MYRTPYGKRCEVQEVVEPTPSVGDAWNITSESAPYVSTESSEESYEGFDVTVGDAWTVTPPE